MHKSHLLHLSGSLLANILLSWTLLPLFLRPLQGYSLSHLLEVLLWQLMGVIGWPFALLGGLLSQIFTPGGASLLSLLLILVYPAILLLLARAVFARRLRRWELPLLHILIVFSFAVVWYSVLSGYDFMPG
jgi:hypothetical protein